MLNKKVLIPVITALLLALGINLERFGIDLNALLGGDGQSVSSRSTGNSAPSSGGKGDRADIFKQPTRQQGQTGAVAGYQSGAKWSKTQPAVNLHHVFEGEINRKGRPVGFHSRPGGADPTTARVVRVRDQPNRLGVYTAMIEVRDGNRWLEKFSSFFPDNMSEQEVVEVIVKAYNSSDKNKQPWRGKSGLGFDIQGYTLSKGDINTAFPVYEK